MGRFTEKLSAKSIKSIKDRLRSSTKRRIAQKDSGEDVAEPPRRESNSKHHHHHHTARDIQEETLQQHFGVIARDPRFAFRPLGIVELLDVPNDLCRIYPPAALACTRSNRTTVSMIARARRALGHPPLGDYSESVARTIVDMIILTAIDEINSSITSYPMEVTRLKYEKPLHCTVVSVDGVHELSGKADYCVGYITDKQGEANLALIEAKRPKEYSSARTQLLAYMSTYIISKLLSYGV
jgi:hypothetical protein